MAELEEKVREGSRSVLEVLELRESEVRKLEEQVQNPVWVCEGCRGRESGRKWLGGSECNCGRRKRWGGMREATTCGGSGEREQQIVAARDLSRGGGRPRKAVRQSCGGVAEEGGRISKG
jgi:hypothetical protein